MLSVAVGCDDISLCCLFLFFVGVTIRLVHMQGKEATKELSRA